jgi:hypothetical protein
MICICCLSCPVTYLPCLSMCLFSLLTCRPTCPVRIVTCLFRLSTCRLLLLSVTLSAYLSLCYNCTCTCVSYLTLQPICLSHLSICFACKFFCLFNPTNWISAHLPSAVFPVCSPVSSIWPPAPNCLPAWLSSLLTCLSYSSTYLSFLPSSVYLSLLFGYLSLLPALLYF